MPSSRMEDIETILDINKAIFSTLETREILYLIVKKISEIIRVRRCSIILIDRRRNVGQVLSTYEDPELDSITLDLNKYPEIIKAISEEKMVLVEDVSADPMMREVKETLLDLGIMTIMVLPLKYAEKTAGALYLRISRKEKKISEKEIRVCEIVSSMASIALNNARLFNIIREEKELLAKMAVTDDMTKLYNHRFFAKRLNEEFKRAARYGTELSCTMIDIDNFKNVNDTYGHQAGDIILKDIAGVIKKCIRESDVVARYGGEEFSVILPHTGSEHAINLANRIRNAVKNYRPDVEGDDLTITVSIGVSTYPKSGIDSMDDLVSQADKGLYQAKNQGKDRVVSL